MADAGKRCAVLDYRPCGDTCALRGCDTKKMMVSAEEALAAYRRMKGKDKRAGALTELADKLKALERENRELRQANEILRKASTYFAQAELDRPLKR